MSINVLLLSEFDEEMKKSRATLARVPSGRNEFAPHPKSMPLGRLAPLVAQLAGFGAAILTTPMLDFGGGAFKPAPLESADQLVRLLDDGAAKSRAALEKAADSAWTEPWTLSLNGTALFSGTRFLAYREMFLNHIVHHRAQLGVYLRLNEKAVPAIYGPSADEPV